MTVERGGSPLPAFVLELIEFCELFVDCRAIPLIAKLMQKAVLLCFPCGCAKRKLPFEIFPRVIGRIEPQLQTEPDKPQDREEHSYAVPAAHGLSPAHAATMPHPTEHIL